MNTDSEQQHARVDKIVANLTPEQLATIQSIEGRIQKGFKEIDNTLAKCIQQGMRTTVTNFVSVMQKNYKEILVFILPIAPIVSPSETADVGNRWKSLNNQQLYNLVMVHNLLNKDDGDFPSRQQMIAMLSTITSNPATLVWGT
jgi:hypothetical protein